MWRERLIGIVTVLSLVAMRSAIAQRGVEPTGKNFHRISTIDTLQFQGMSASPDGRWIAIQSVEGIFMMPADGHAKPIRLLSPGYSDRSPVWFPGSDRLAFLSNRASRDGSERWYVMTVTIDTRTGQTTAPPRQISTEETPVLGGVSPDGKWVAYAVPAEGAWKAVPATGGVSHILLKRPEPVPGLIWSRDGKTMYFAVGKWRPASPSLGIWYKQSVNGGSATRAYQNPDAMPYVPNTDMHVVYVRRGDAEGNGVKRVELYDAKEQLVGATDMIKEMTVFFPWAASGGTYATTSNNRQETSLVTLDGGSTRTLAASPAWVNGWVDNSTMLIDGRDSGRLFVATLDTAGHEGTHVILPADARGSGWGGVVEYATPFFRGTQLPDPSSVYTADARTGAIKELAANALSVESDNKRFVVGVANGQEIELRGITIDGRSTLIRSFSKSDHIGRMTVRGELVAWSIQSGDSVTVFSARGATGRPHKLITVRSSRYNRFEFVWSFDGSMLAVTGITADPSLSVIHVDENGAPRGAPVALNPRATSLWSLRWTSDNRSLVLTGVPTGAKEEVLMQVPVDPKEPPTFYGRNDEWPVVSPDGKRVAYPAVRHLGTTIWKVDFVTAGRVDSNGKP